MEKITLAGGCFWCIEQAFSKIYGIHATRVGYMGGKDPHPNYDIVCGGQSGHREVVEVSFDSEKITLLQVLDIFWHHIDPFDEAGQFHDRGAQYKTAIFYHNAKQKELALLSKSAVAIAFGKEVATEILEAKGPFYEAESYHQHYSEKEPLRYQSYAKSHEPILKSIWQGRDISYNLKDYLTPLQYNVTQVGGTEPAFKNAYWDNHEKGLYCDITNGELLFSSDDKFDSGTGWPSFTKPIHPEAVITKEDIKLGYVRLEVIAKKSGAHLGHLFPDGPPPLYSRYCINSAALKFMKL